MLDITRNTSKNKELQTIGIVRVQLRAVRIGRSHSVKVYIIRVLYERRNGCHYGYVRRNDSMSAYFSATLHTSSHLGKRTLYIYIYIEKK